MDVGSSINVLFKEAFDRMQLNPEEFQPVTSLFDFVGHEVRPLGKISLPLSPGEEPQWQTKIVPFTVLEVPSAYNAIFSRPALATF